MPGLFKLDNLHPFEPILFEQFSICIILILGGQFLLPQRASSEKREISQLQEWMIERDFGALGIQTGPYATL